MPELKLWIGRGVGEMLKAGSDLNPPSCIKKAYGKVERRLESDTRESVQVGLIDRRVHQPSKPSTTSPAEEYPYPPATWVISRCAIRPWRIQAGGDVAAPLQSVLAPSRRPRSSAPRIGRPEGTARLLYSRLSRAFRFPVPSAAGEKRIVSSRLFFPAVRIPDQGSRETPSDSRDGGAAQPPAPSGGKGGGGGAPAGGEEGPQAEVPGFRPCGGGAGRGVPRGALRARQGPRRPTPPGRRRRRVRGEGHRRPRLRPLPRRAPRRPRLRRPQGRRHGARAGQAPPWRVEGRVGAGLRGGPRHPGGGARADRRGAAVWREGRGPRGAGQGGARGQGRVRARGAGGQGPVRALRARGGAPRRLHLALTQRPAGVPPGRADRRAHRRVLGREVQQGDRRGGQPGLHRSQVPPGHPHRAHRQGVLFVDAGVRAFGRDPVVYCVLIPSAHYSITQVMGKLWIPLQLN